VQRTACPEASVDTVLSNIKRIAKMYSGLSKAIKLKFLLCKNLVYPVCPVNPVKKRHFAKQNIKKYIYHFFTEKPSYVD
jgi:hypothetical protein